ncbi:hypothetical protein ACFQE0_24160 [Methylobacterium komagatae]|uniref:XRE family transcriptional regulator n=1 Tax=Methylobacterium komagatae TaxID=374425 RepID=A0ABW2BRA6_9HYPH
MTDAGVFPFKTDRAATERARLLRQIADVLDLPLTAFTHPPATETGEEAASDECAAVIKAFSRIRDPKMREFCLKMLESFAERG